MSKPEIKTITNLEVNKKYFSRSMNVIFTVLKMNKYNSEIQIGVDGKALTRSFALFQKQYFVDGVVEE